MLAVLAEEPRHGYAIALALESRGLGRPRGGSLYPTLAGLEADGAIVAIWESGESGPGRRTYSLTPAGLERLSDERAKWMELTLALGDSEGTNGDA
ncbi:PadR family transcriptional regulator PadR [Microbacterium marinum]|uniref:PadR family transcriptional regulator PadR n=1 Tax=Microbacterium marinum TaxID=421115 RepID=A0A7W7BU53_9MICO|nr:PadR family transcriptional regulator PadR [Microbacterium marinum]